MKMNLDITKPCYSEQILPVPWPFVISRFHCNCILGDPGAVSRVDKMFVVKVYCKIETSPNLRLWFMLTSVITCWLRRGSKRCEWHHHGSGGRCHRCSHGLSDQVCRISWSSPDSVLWAQICRRWIGIRSWVHSPDNIDFSIVLKSKGRQRK